MVMNGSVPMTDVVVGYFAYSDDSSKVATSMISVDNSPPSADPDSYPNFVAFNSEDIV